MKKISFAFLGLALFPQCSFAESPAQPQTFDSGEHHIAFFDGQPVGTKENHYIVNGDGDIELGSGNTNLHVGAGTVNFTEVNGGILQAGSVKASKPEGPVTDFYHSTLNHTTVREEGLLWVQTTANDNKIYDSTLHIKKEDYSFPGANEDHEAPALAKDNQLFGESELIVDTEGTAENNRINHLSQMSIRETGIAKNTILNDQSKITIFEGGQSLGELRLNGSSNAYLSSGKNGGAFVESVTLDNDNNTIYIDNNLSTQEGSRLAVTIGELHATQGGTLEFVSSGTKNHSYLHLNHLKGEDLHFKMRTDLAEQTGDFIQISGTSEGNHMVTVKNDGSAKVDGNEKINMIRTVDGGAAFKGTSPVELGGYTYRFEKLYEDNQEQRWGLTANGGGTSTTDAAVHAFSGGYLLNYVETQTLLQRMGDLRDKTSKGNIWARTFGGKIHSTGDGFLRGYDLKYGGLQVGADKKIPLSNKKGDFYIGGFFGYSDGDLDYGRGSGNIDSKTIGTYGTYIASSGFYADLVLKYSWMKNKFNVLDSQGMRVTGNELKTDGLSASLEVGQRFYFDQRIKDGWYIEPHAQISWGHQSGGTFYASNGLKVKAESYESTLGRVGAKVGYNVKSGKNPINAYAKVSFNHEFNGDMSYYLNHSKETVSFGDSWWTYGLGVAAQLNTRHHVYMDIERAEGGKFTQNWALNAGYRYSW